MATYASGGSRRATPNTVTAMRRSAESRKCPVCGRKSGLTQYRGEFFSVRYCRWSREDRCSYTVEAALDHALARHEAFDDPDERTIRRIRYEIASR